MATMAIIFLVLWSIFIGTSMTELCWDDDDELDCPLGCCPYQDTEDFDFAEGKVGCCGPGLAVLSVIIALFVFAGIVAVVFLCQYVRHHGKFPCRDRRHDSYLSVADSRRMCQTASHSTHVRDSTYRTDNNLSAPYPTLSIRIQANPDQANTCVQQSAVDDQISPHGSVRLQPSSARYQSIVAQSNTGDTILPPPYPAQPTIGCSITEHPDLPQYQVASESQAEKDGLYHTGDTDHPPPYPGVSESNTKYGLSMVAKHLSALNVSSQPGLTTATSSTSDPQHSLAHSILPYPPDQTVSIIYQHHFPLNQTTTTSLYQKESERLNKNDHSPLPPYPVTLASPHIAVENSKTLSPNRSGSENPTGDQSATSDQQPSTPKHPPVIYPVASGASAGAFNQSIAYDHHKTLPYSLVPPQSHQTSRQRKPADPQIVLPYPVSPLQ